MKSYTDINQSRKLAEFLSHKNADQTWERIVIAGANFDVQDELQYKHNGDMPFNYYSGIGVPCWSLVALLNVLPSGKALIHDKESRRYKCICNNIDTDFYDNPVDACVAMIEKLNELKML